MSPNQFLEHRASPPSSSAGTLVARRHDTLDTLEPVWRLLETKGLATAFQQFDWVRTIEEQLARPRSIRPFVVEVRDARSGEMRMLLPFILKRRAMHSVIEYMGLNVCDISAPLIAPGYRFPEQSGATLWSAIRAVFPKADLVNVDLIAPLIRGHLNPLATLPGIQKIALQSFDVAIDGDPESIVDRIANGRMSRTLKRSSKRMAEQGAVRFMVARTREDLDMLLPVMIAQRLERFRALDRFDLLADARVQSFYRHAAITSLDGHGPVRVFGLSVGDEWIATAYGLVHADTFHLIIITMAGGAWEACSPGMAIIAQFIRWARREGLTMMDFSIGEMDYKIGFGGQARDLYALSHPLTARGRIAVAIRHIAVRTKEKVKAYPRVFRYLRSFVRFYKHNKPHS